MSAKILNKVIKVGSISHHGNTKFGEKKPIYYSYKAVEFKDGWAESSKFLPQDFDLVYGKTTSGDVKSCWLNGSKWDGLRLKNDDQIVRWRRKEEVEEL